MKYLKIILALLLVLFVLPVTALGSQQLPVQPGHKVTLTQLGSRQANGSDIYWWDIKTVQDAVDADLVPTQRRRLHLPTMRHLSLYRYLRGHGSSYPPH